MSAASKTFNHRYFRGQHTQLCSYQRTLSAETTQAFNQTKYQPLALKAFPQTQCTSGSCIQKCFLKGEEGRNVTVSLTWATLQLVITYFVRDVRSKKEIAATVLLLATWKIHLQCMSLHPPPHLIRSLSALLSSNYLLYHLLYLHIAFLFQVLVFENFSKTHI